MKCIYFTVTFLLSLQNFATNAAKRQQEEQWLKYYGETQNMLCGPPQTRALPVKQFRHLIDRNVISDLELETFFPRWVVIDVCRHSGCCKNFGEVCVPVEKAAKNRIFMYKKGRKILFHRLRVDNHVACACRSVKATPKNGRLVF